MLLKKISHFNSKLVLQAHLKATQATATPELQKSLQRENPANQDPKNCHILTILKYRWL